MINNSINVLGVGVSKIDMNLAVKTINEIIDTNSKGYVCVTGVHGIMEAQKNPSFRTILNSSNLCTPDGMPLVWVGWLKGVKYMDRVYGPDLMFALCEESIRKKYTHFLFGGDEGIAPLLKQNLVNKFPGLNIVGTYTPPFRPLNQKEEIKLDSMIKELQPDIFWVGLSTPKQEIFMNKYLEKLQTKIMIGVGAAFDFHTGRKKQAPKWIQRSGLEWAFRLKEEPQRLWKRYFYNNPAFLFKIFTQLLALKKYEMN